MYYIAIKDIYSLSSSVVAAQPIKEGTIIHESHVHLATRDDLKKADGTYTFKAYVTIDGFGDVSIEDFEAGFARSFEDQ